jgi:hypothetical protein
MDEPQTREILVLVTDGGSECGVAVELGAFGPRKILADKGATDHVRDACAVINRLIQSGVTFEALAALSADSPRVGDVVEQIRQRIAAQEFEEATTQGDQP